MLGLFGLVDVFAELKKQARDWFLCLLSWIYYSTFCPRALEIPPSSLVECRFIEHVGDPCGAYTGRFLGSGVQGRGPWRGFGGVPQASLSSSAAGGVPNKPTCANPCEVPPP